MRLPSSNVSKNLCTGGLHTLQRPLFYHHLEWQLFSFTIIDRNKTKHRRIGAVSMGHLLILVIPSRSSKSGFLSVHIPGGRRE